MIIESYGVIRYCEFNENSDDKNEIYFTCRHESSDCKILAENRKKSSNCYIEECSGNTQSINCVSKNEPYDEKKSAAKKSQGICDFRGSVFKCDHGSTQCEGRASLRCKIDPN